MNTVYDNLQRIKTMNRAGDVFNVDESVVALAAGRADYSQLTKALTELSIEAMVSGDKVLILIAALTMYGLLQFSLQHNFTVDTPPVSSPEKN